MKLFLSAICLFAFAMTIPANDIEQIHQELQKNQHAIQELDRSPAPSGKKYLYISSSFGKSKLEDQSQLQEIKSALIEKVEYVNTSYSRGKKFDQFALDKRRLEKLEKSAPWLLQRKMVNWVTIAQTGAFQCTDAKRMFHGFRITYRPQYDEKMAKEEADYIDEVLTRGSLAPSPELHGDRDLSSPTEGIITTCVIKTSSSFGEAEIVDTLVFKGGASTLSYAKPDSTIFNVLERNKDWKDNIIVHDVTGSMSPYTIQVLLWHQLNFESNRNLGYVFFNDGNNMLDQDKIAGKVGGVYFAEGNSLDQVKKVAKNAMFSGYGGDLPENNIEATLRGIEQFPKAKNVVMIADNWATPRDLEFADKLALPIKIILCGTHWGINTAYLDLAKKTGGSVHTIEKDIVDLAKLHEGESFELNHITYKILKGKFVKIASL